MNQHTEYKGTKGTRLQLTLLVIFLATLLAIMKILSGTEWGSVISGVLLFYNASEYGIKREIVQKGITND